MRSVSVKDMWTALRKDIDKIRKEHTIPCENFEPVPIDEWRKIQENIISTFCELTPWGRPHNWIWECFKQDTFSVGNICNHPFDLLPKLIDHQEKVWLILNETVNEKDKWWVYDGFINTIKLILNESTCSDEVYIVSKKYDWLLCVNHHNVIITTGKLMPDKLRKLEKSINQAP